MTAILCTSRTTKVELLRQKSKKGQGRLVVEFYSDEDLNEVYQRLVEDLV